MNGAGTSYPGLGSQQSTGEQPVITINLGLSAKQILAGFGGLAATIMTAATAGFLFIPAKDTDLQAVKAVVEIVRSEQQSSREAVSRLTQAVDNLAGQISDLKRDRSSETLVKPRQRPIQRPTSQQ